MSAGLVAGLGGGLCNLGNTVHLLAFHSPVTVTEIHTHSDALAPDEGKRIPYATGTNVSDNYIDFRFKNTTDQSVQLRLWCENERLFGELRSEGPFPYQYELIEEGHRFRWEDDGEIYRVSKIYRVTRDASNGREMNRELVRDNHSEVMYDYSLVPKELLSDA